MSEAWFGLGVDGQTKHARKAPPHCPHGRTYLRVLVDEHEGVGHVVVPQVDHRGTDPRPEPLLRLVQNLLCWCVDVV